MDTPSTPSAESQTLNVISFKVADSDRRRLEAVATEDDRSVSWVLRQAVRRYLEEREAA